MLRRLGLPLALVIALTATFGAHAAMQGSPAAAASKTITLGNIGWDEDVAVNNVAALVLHQKYGYTVNLKMADAGPLYLGVATGQIDGFMDTWLPKTQAIYWSKYKNKLTKLHPWFTGANIGLAVPNYVHAKSIADLSKMSSQLGGKITGIEAGAGEMHLVQTKVIPGYHLPYTLQDASTPAMLAALQSAIKHQKPIVVTLWKPHWAFTQYPIRYLSDPKHLMSGAENLSPIVRKGLAKSDPQAYKLLNHMRFTEPQLGALEVDIRAKGAVGGAQYWMSKNHMVVKQLA